MRSLIDIRSAPANMDIPGWFSHYVYAWLHNTEKKTVEWVENVIREDQASDSV
jgi:hypothetical protein